MQISISCTHHSTRKKEIEPTLTCQDICILAVEKVKEFECSGLYEESINDTYQFVPRKVMKWFCQFQDNDKSFVNTPYHTSLINKDPLIFQLNPSLKDRLLKYTKEHIAGLKGEDLYSFFRGTIIPKLIEQEKEETNETLTKQEILKQYSLTIL